MGNERKDVDRNRRSSVRMSDLNRAVEHVTKAPRTILQDMQLAFDATIAKSKRVLRAARKRFRKGKQVPNGTFLQYSSKSATSAHPTLPPWIITQHKMLDEKAKLMFKKPYFSLDSKKRTLVHEEMNSRESKTDWSHVKEVQ